MVKRIAAIGLALAVAGCTSVGQVGLMTNPTGDAGEIIREARSYRELGPVEGKACRMFIVGLIPLGDSTSTTAMKNALENVRGDAIINATVETSLYGFIPIYNVFAITCTTVRGIAIRFDEEEPSA